jgi:hypothetical protein
MEQKDLKISQVKEYIRIIKQYRPNETLPDVDETYNQKIGEVISIFRGKNINCKESMLIVAINRELNGYKGTAIRDLKNCIELLKREEQPKQLRKPSFLERLQMDLFKPQEDIEDVEKKQKINHYINKYYETNRIMRSLDLDKHIEDIVLAYIESTPYREPQKSIEFLREDMKNLGYLDKLESIEKRLNPKEIEIDER